MIFRMDSDAVRAMAAKFRSTAEAMETSLTAINQGVKGAPWQSQAREEFITLLETLQSGTLRSAEVLRMMAGAAEEKASQWEVIANIFNGPFQALSGLWNRLKDNMGWLWSTIKGAITGIRLPSIPKIVLPVIAFGGIAGWFQKIIPDWDWKKLTWWPPKKSGSSTGTKETDEEDRGQGENEGGSADSSAKEEQETPTSGDQQEPYNKQYDGSKPAPGMDSTYGKPGQLPLDAPVKSDESNRSPELYEDVINQFAVGNNPRYKKDANTYCNTFAGDVARAMGVPLPQKNEWGLNPKDRATIGFPQLYDYFTNPDAPMKASDASWVEIGKSDLATLESHVNSGKMAIVVNNGHISVVKPGQNITGFDSIQIAQAGGTNSNNLTLSQGFGESQEPRIFIID